MKRLMIIFATLFVAFTSVFAQNQIKVKAPNMVGADEQFNVTFVIEGEDAPSDFNWEQGEDFQLVWGPQKGTSTSISIINGKRTRSSQVTYTYVLLPRRKGTCHIAEASAMVGGNRIHSSAFSIEVVADQSSAPSSQQQRQGSGQSAQSQPSNGNISSDDLFMKLTLSKTNVVVGEPVNAVIKLYQRVNIAGFEDVKFPSFTGFWSQEVDTPSNIEFHRENVNDQIYNAATLRSYVLIPQQSGTLTIDPAELVCLVNVRTASTSNSIFDSFFQDNYRTIRRRVVTDARTINVSALPAGAPASFGGGVGTFSMDVKVSKDSLKSHDAASVVVTVSGNGNVSLLESPKINFPPDFEVYDVKTTDRTDKSGGRISGSKSFEYPFIPRSHGDFEIPSVEYSYYDVNSRRYVTLSSGPLSLHVSKGAESSGATMQTSSGLVRKDVKDLGSDIRFINTKKASFSDRGVFFVWSPLFLILAAIILVGACAAYFVLKSAAAKKADVAGTKNRKATKMAQKRLSQAGTYLKGNLYTAFYEELHKALLGFVSDKLNMDLAEMSKENISASLVAGGVPEAVASEFTGLLDACEFARYSPDSGHEAMNAHFETAMSVISMIDSSMKGKKTSAAGKAVTALMLMIALPSALNAADNTYIDDLWTNGQEAYTQNNWQGALEAWQQIESLGLESPELYYNIGNAYFKNDDIAHAVLYYERTLRLDPSYSDARFNLEYAHAMIQDKIESVPEFFIKSWLSSASHVLKSDTWAVLSLVMLAAFLACAVLFLLGGSPARKKTGFFTGITALLLFILCVSFASSQKSAYERLDSAVVMNSVVSVKSSPSSGSAKDLFVLHEGTKVKVLDTVGDWQNIELSDGRQGWVRSGDIEFI